MDYSSIAISSNNANTDTTYNTTPIAPSTNQYSQYLYAADNHNYGNNNFAFTDPDTWSDGISNAGKFIVSSVVSGANSIFTSGTTVANWFGADIEQKDTAAILSDLDDDLGKYYVQNKESADLVGFILGSFIPGMAGVKILNAGQKVLTAGIETGIIGSNLARATGLLVPNVSKYTTLAASELAQSSATFSFINTNVLKAVGSGVGQAALESAAFETAVAATMFKSPVLEKSDGWDIAQNIAIGGLFGGVVGGAFNAASIYGKVKSGIKAADLAEKPFTYISELPNATAAQRIVQRVEDLNNIPAIQEGSEYFAKHTRLAQNKTDKLQNLIKLDLQDIVVNKNQELVNDLASSIKGLSSQQVAQNFLYLDQVGTLSDVLNVEKKLAGLKNPQKSTGKVGYVKLQGEDSGAVYFDSPKVYNIADALETSNPAKVLKQVESYGFNINKQYAPEVSLNHTEAEARYIWADRLDNKLMQNGMTIGEHDIPLLEKALETKLTDIKVASTDGYEYNITTADDIFKHVQVTKQEVANLLLQGKKAGTGLNTEEIAKIVNVKKSYLEGQLSPNLLDDIFARQYYNKIAGEDISLKPSYIKASYKVDQLKDSDGMLLDGMTYITTKQRMYQGAVNTVFSKYSEDLYDRFYHPSNDLLLKANRFGAGSGLFSYSNGNYGSLESWAEQIGSATNSLRRVTKDKTSELLQTPLYRLANNQAAAIEFEAINQRLAGIADKYVLDETAGQQGIGRMIPRSIQKYNEGISNGAKNLELPIIQEGAPLEIPINSADTLAAIKAHMGIDTNRVTGYKELRAVQGMEDAKVAGTFYPIRPNPKDYPNVAFVIDPTVTATGHVSMIHAATANELEQLIDKVPSKYKVITKAQSEEFHRAEGDYGYDNTLHENYIDGALQSRGINTQFFPKTNPQKIVESIIDHHTRKDDVFVRELVNSKFEKEFGEFRRLGEQYSNIATSQYGGSYRYLENTTKNPYLDYIKTALDISKTNEYPLLTGLNTSLDSAVSKAMNTVTSAFKSLKSSTQLDEINSLLNQYGIKTAYYDATTDLLANHSAPKGVLNSFIRGANSMLSAVTLRLDFLNSINNAVGASVLLGAETKSLTRAIQGGNTEVAGELGNLMKINIPGMEEAIRSPSKLVAKSMADFISNSPEAILKKEVYKKNGWITDMTSQFQSMLDDLTLTGSESTSILNKKLNEAFIKTKGLLETGEKITGNKYAEEFNRYVAADVMKQISDYGVKAGVIDTKTQLSYINTFVNRTQGNILASQRPLMFQGAIGQAVGLFQSYQFNLMQQLFRHVSEGSTKDAAMLLGLQGTIYGMNGLPAFNFINTHIIGNASGNPEHVDLYSSIYGIAGKQTGDWLMYGVPSNILRTNLYTRGDINPRQLTIIPTNPADIPIVSATVGTYNNIKQTLDKIGVGANVWETVLQGIEHNGLSRPLAGLAQIVEGHSTTTKGTIVRSNDLLSLASISRIAGGRPFDEAVVNDAVYRISAYQATDRVRKEDLVQAVKSTGIGSNEPTQDQIEQFANKYAALGGTQREFNKWMLTQIKNSNTSQADKIIQHLQSPYSQNLQRVMGGNEF